MHGCWTVAYIQILSVGCKNNSTLVPLAVSFTKDPVISAVIPAQAGNQKISKLSR